MLIWVCGWRFMTSWRSYQSRMAVVSPPAARAWRAASITPLWVRMSRSVWSLIHAIDNGVNMMFRTCSRFSFVWSAISWTAVLPCTNASAMSTSAWDGVYAAMSRGEMLMARCHALRSSLLSHRLGFFARFLCLATWFARCPWGTSISVWELPAAVGPDTDVDSFVQERAQGQDHDCFQPEPLVEVVDQVHLYVGEVFVFAVLLEASTDVTGLAHVEALSVVVQDVHCPNRTRYIGQIRL